MKKAIFILSAIIATTTIIWSCTKEETKTGPNNSKPVSLYESQVNKTIQQFRKTLAYYHENPDFKSGETVSADSVLWFLEATINYSHAFPNEYYNKFEVDSFYLSIPVNTDGTVDMDVMAQKYAEMKTNVANDYHNSAFTEKGLSFVNISENLQKSTGEINLLVETGTGQRGVDPGPPGPFVDGDDWYYGEYVGHCNPHTYDTDAAHQLMIAMNSDIPDPTGNYFFVNLTTKIKYGGASELRRDGDPDPINNNFDYYLYSTRTDINPFNSSTLCLSHIEMNYYFSFLQYLLYTKIPDEELMQGYAIQSVVGMIGYWEGIGTIDKHYLHKGTFQFGKKVYYASEEPEEL